jgi:hypothetical protein
MRIAALGNSYSKDLQLINLGRQIQTQLSALPGVKSVALSSRIPLGDGDGTTDFRIMGRPYNGEHNEVAYRDVSANYFSTLQGAFCADVTSRTMTTNPDRRSPSLISKWPDNTSQARTR